MIERYIEWRKLNSLLESFACSKPTSPLTCKRLNSDNSWRAPRSPLQLSSVQLFPWSRDTLRFQNKINAKMECARWTCLQSRTSNTLFGLRKAWGRAVTKGWSKMQWDERSRSRHMRVADRLQKLKRRSRGQSEQSDLILSQIWKQSMRCSTQAL